MTIVKDDAMNNESLLAAFQRLGRPKVLVLGDLILDRYTYGDAERVSQESPVIVLRADSHELRLGGAANVCNMLRGLECEVIAAGVVGSDAAGCDLIDLLEKTGVDASLCLTDASRPTTLKERFVGRAGARHPSQILRVDHETTDAVSGDIEERLLYGVVNRLDDCDIVLISDYAKGVCTPAILQTLIRCANERGVPVLVDPMKGRDFGRYRGADLIKANRIETESCTGRKIRTPDEAALAGQELCAALQLEAVIVTLDSDGMALVEKGGAATLFPTEARSVYDITGAGDMVLAMLGAAIGSGLTRAEAVRLANVAAGLEVEKIGVAVIPLDEIEAELTSHHQPGVRKIMSLEQLARQADELRRRGQRIVFTNGCFDLLHYGHVSNLNEASRMGDILVVGLNSDTSVARLKGPERPVINQVERAAMLAALSCVDYVAVFDQETPLELIQAIRPHVLAKGGDYKAESIVGYDFVTSYGGEVRLINLVDGHSTTDIIRRVTEAQPPRRQAA
ncbi:ADP-heptose synthase [Blastopirellula marina DSM 3645]|uniref:Bifunctional protein HldE n=2 Tax=Blastopirellula marina TaxID=124 RepID=A3ZNV4_9BACT|nr:ADP-heptose synthase [Blastopirellula marina DSM 3645]